MKANANHQNATDSKKRKDQPTEDTANNAVHACYHGPVVAAAAAGTKIFKHVKYSLVQQLLGYGFSAGETKAIFWGSQDEACPEINAE